MHRRPETQYPNELIGADWLEKTKYMKKMLEPAFVEQKDSWLLQMFIILILLPIT